MSNGGSVEAQTLTAPEGDLHSRADRYDAEKYWRWVSRTS
jgi:hypothetical protein